MSSNSRNKVEKILDALCEYENVENYNQLAPLLDYNPSTVYKWVERNSIPVKNLSKKRPDINRAFLMGKDAQIENEEYLRSAELNTESAKEVNEKVTKFLTSSDKVEHDSPVGKLLLSVRSQLKAQRNQTDSMIHHLDILLGLRSDK